MRDTYCFECQNMSILHLERVQIQHPVPLLSPQTPSTQVRCLAFYQAIGHKATLCIFNDLLLVPLSQACKHINVED